MFARVDPRSLRSSLLAVLPLALALSASAQTMSAVVGLDVAQETPAPVGGFGSGTATVTVDATSRLMTVSGSYTGLSSNQTLAHLHISPFGSPGPIVIALNATGGTSGTFSRTTTLNAANFNAFKTGKLYINIHTVNNPSGEIRGQIVNIVCAAQNATDPTLVDSGGDPLRGPRINDATERFNVTLDCSNAGAAGVYTIVIHSGTLAPPAATVYGSLWYSGTKLTSVSGAHAQNIVDFAPAPGIVLPNSASLLGVWYNVQGYCSDPSAPPGRLGEALIQVIE